MVYDFTNGFHDASDMIATAIASMSMTPRAAILLVTVFTFLGPFLGGVAVADTIGEFVRIKGEPQSIALSVTMAALLAAITFNIVTWKLGGGVDHIGIVTDVWSESSKRCLIVHNIGAGVQIEDVLFRWHIIGHYRFF